MTETPPQELNVRAAADNRGLRRRLFLGVGAQGLTFVATIVQQLLLVPLFLAVWGSAVYGEWLVLVAAADFLRLVEFGLQYHLTNTMRMAWARGETAQFDRALRIGLGIYAMLLSVAAPVVIAAIFLVDWPSLFGETAMPDASAVWTLAVLAFTTLILLPRNLLVASYAARGEFSRGETLYALYSFGQSAVTAGALALGATPAVVALACMANAVVVGCGVVVADQIRRYPGSRFGLALPTVHELRGLFGKARHYFVPDVADIVTVRAPILILGLLAPPAAVVLFSVSRTFTGVVRQIVLQVARVSGIEMSRQHAQQDAAGRRALYMNTGRTIGATAGLLSGVALGLAGRFIPFWTHGEVPVDAPLIVVLLAAVFLAAPAQTGFAALHFMNLPRPLAAAAAVQAGGGLLLCLLLIPHAGALGAGVAVAIAEVAAMGLYISAVASRDAGVNLGAYLLQTTVPGAILFAVAYSAVRLLVP